MSIAATAGVAIARQLIPGLFERLAQGRGDAAERVAGAVSAVVMDVAGLGPDMGPDAALQALRDDPAAYARVQDAATKLAIAELEAETRARELVVQDRASARDMQKSTDSGVPAALVWVAAGYVILVALSVLAIIVLSLKVDPLMAGLLGFVIRDAGERLAQVYSFFFGSSSGSKVKTDVMSLEIEKLQRR